VEAAGGGNARQQLRQGQGEVEGGAGGLAGDQPVVHHHRLVHLGPGPGPLQLPGGLGGVASMEGSGPAMALIRQAAENPEIWLAAICAAPTLLARAGLLGSGVHAVCYPGMEDELSAAGAVPQMDRPVVAEGSLITGRGPGAAFDFGLALVEALAGAETAEQIRAGLHYGS